MRIKLDENVPVFLAEELRRHGHDVDTVVLEGLRGYSDEAVLEQATATNRAILTNDRHLGDLRRVSGTGIPAVIFLRLRGNDPDLMIHRMREVLNSHDLSKWIGHIVVISHDKLRKRKLAP